MLRPFSPLSGFPYYSLRGCKCIGAIVILKASHRSNRTNTERRIRIISRTDGRCMIWTISPSVALSDEKMPVVPAAVARARLRRITVNHAMLPRSNASKTRQSYPAALRFFIHHGTWTTGEKLNTHPNEINYSIEHYTHIKHIYIYVAPTPCRLRQTQ